MSEHLPTVPLQRAESHRIDRRIAEEAYKEYAARGNSDQSFDRLHERGGFGAIELATLLFQRIKRLEGKSSAEMKGGAE